MYKLSFNSYPIYDLSVDGYSIRSTSLHLGINESGSFKFTVETSHPNFTQLKKMSGLLELTNGDNIVYRGRITRMTSDWNNSQSIESEGVLSCLNDSIIPPFSFPSDFESDPEYEEASLHGNVVQYFFSKLLEYHNSQVTEEQKLYIGTVTVADSNNYIYRTSEDYASAWSIMKNKLVESELGGYLIVRYESDKTYLDYYAELPETNTQKVEFGENLLDLSTEEDASELYSAILPIGNDNLTIADLPDRSLSDDLVKSGSIIYSISARQKYGKITSIQTWDDITEASNLLAKAAELMLTGAAVFTRTITVSACDLHLTDEQISEFCVGKKTVLYSVPHNISVTYPLSSLDMDIQKPGSTVIKLSIDTSKDGITGSLGNVEKSQSNQTDRLYTMLEKYYKKNQVDTLLTEKVSIDDFGSVLEDVLAVSDVAIGGSLTVGGLPVDGKARFS